MDPRYIGQDIDLATLTDEQIPELRRRVAVAKEEHERLMQEKRERLAAQEQARLEAEIALEELRLGPRGPALRDLAKARATRAAGGPS